MPLTGQERRLPPGPDFRYNHDPRSNAAFTFVRDPGGEGAMSVRFEHRNSAGTASPAAPAGARILGLLLLIRP